MLTDDDLDKIKKLLQPISEDIEGLKDETSLLNKRFDAFLKATQEGFRKVQQRFSEIDDRFDGMEERFDVMDGKIDQVLFYATKMNDDFEKRLKKLEGLIRT